MSDDIQRRKREAERQGKVAAKEESERLAEESRRRIDQEVAQLIASIPQLVKDAAAKGERHLHVKDVTPVRDPVNRGIFSRVLDDPLNGYRPGCLNDRDRRIYDWCQSAGFKTRLHLLGAHKYGRGWIEIEW
jgi:hypothetical protein